MFEVLKRRPETANGLILDKLALFSFFWAGQSLFQLAFIPDWKVSWDPLGWSAFLLGMAVLVTPSNFRLFLASVIVTTAYHMTHWPFIINHVLLDTFISATLIMATLTIAGPAVFRRQPLSDDVREDTLQTFTPVVTAMFVLMYYSIFLSKLNHDFFNLDISCMQTMYTDFVETDPIGGLFAPFFSIPFLFFVFMVAEAILPIMLTFRKTRLLAFYIGVPFHLLLGYMEHWPFASIALVLYALVALRSIHETLPLILGWIGKTRLRWLIFGFRLYLVIIIALVIIGPVFYADREFVRYSIRLLNWVICAVGLSALIMISVFRTQLLSGPVGGHAAAQIWSSKPGWLWGFAILTAMNSLSPYIGFKTQNSVSMYSNLRTEGPKGNHFFMPSLRLFKFQDDLVEVQGANYPEIAALATHPRRFTDTDTPLPVYLTYFEFRRAVSRLKADDLVVTYSRKGETRTFRTGAADNADVDLDKPIPLLLERTARFRPVFKGDTSYCLH